MRKKQAKGQVIVVRYADDIVMGFQHKREAERFMAEMRERLEKFALSLHREKTRLIEFGRFGAKDRESRGLGKPETLGSLTSAAGPAGAPSSSNGRRAATGYGQGCEQSKRSCGGACTNRSRFRVSGSDRSFGDTLAYHAVPANSRCLGAFRHYVVDLWRWSQVILIVFRKLVELGTVRQTLMWFLEHGLEVTNAHAARRDALEETRVSLDAPHAD